MKISFLGGAGTVTGSMYLVRINKRNILLECGLYQGKRDKMRKRNRKFSFDVRRLNAVVLSHAHIDHSGNLPNLVKGGYGGPIYATHATRDLCSAMLPDSGRIHEHDIAYANKLRIRRGQPPMKPLYTEDDALHTLRQFVSVGYSRSISLGKGVKLTFLDAGHILGSAMVLLTGQENGMPLRLLFSGDLGQPDLPIVRDPTPMPPTDYLMVESTYGDRVHPPIEDTQQQLATIVNKVVARGGRIIIPAFAVGRTQEIVYDLHQLTLKGQIPEIPVYVDSPLALNVTEVFRRHPDCYDRETHDFISQGGGLDPFGFSRLRYVRSVAESKALNDITEPIIIISASGMAEAGRVQHHLKHAVADGRNAVLITGWQAPNTLGRRIVEGAEFVRIFGESFPMRAEVYALLGYSGHADRDDLLNWLAPQAGAVKAAFVVHGEPKSATALAAAMRKQGYTNVIIPQRKDTVAF